MVGDLVDLVESAGAFGGNGKEATAVNKPVNSEEPVRTEDFATAQRRKETALANLRELEHAQKLGAVVDVCEMERAWATAGQTLRDGLLSLPERVSEYLAAVTDSRQIRDKLRAEIRTILGNLPEQIRAIESDQQAA